MSTQATTLPTLPDERAAFEAWYAEDASKNYPGWMKPSDIFELREGDHYGDHRVMLNGKWEGWQARAAIAAQAQPKPYPYVHARYDMSAAETESQLRDKLIGLGWTPPAQAQPPDRVPMPQNADQAAAMAMLGEAWLREHAPERLTLSISVQEAWEAAGGNPGIKATNAELLASLRLLDAVCDEADAQEDQRRARGVPSGGANVFQTMTPGAKEALARLERVACLQATAMHSDDIHHIRQYLIAQQLAAAPQAEPQPVHRRHTDAEALSCADRLNRSFPPSSLKDEAADHIRELVAASAEPQPEREPIPRVLFDGFSVLQALDPRAKARTGSENVSDVLDAVVKIMRAGIGTNGGGKP